MKIPKELRSEELLDVFAKVEALTGPKLRQKLEGHIAALELEEHFHHKLISRQGKLLTGVVDALRGPPGPLALHSHHDAPVLAARAVGLLRMVADHVRAPSEGAAEQQLIDALAQVEAFLPPVRPLTDAGVPLPNWRMVFDKAQAGLPLEPIEAFILANLPGDDQRAREWLEQLRKMLDTLPR